MPGKEPAKSPAKYIYVYRNPKDTAVSLYHHAQSLYLGPTPWDGFIELLMSGRMFYGDMLDHHSGWWKHKGM